MIWLELMIWLEMLAQETGQRLTLSLAHFVWQGALVALGLAAALRSPWARRASARYALCVAALAAMAACPAATFVALLGVEMAPGAALAPSAGWAEAPLPGESLEATPSFAAEPNLPGGAWFPLSPASLNAGLAPWQPALLATWLAGALALNFRLCLAAWAARGLARSGAALPVHQRGLVDRVARRLGLPRVGVLVSDRAAEAVALGLFRPLVLLPVAWVARLPPDMLAALVAHELAHVRRWDLWINFAQRIVETWLFYHPAVWWVSRLARQEREKCCDELAVAVTGERVVYAKTLEWAARQRLDRVSPAFAAAIGGGREMKLLDRVRNVLGAPSAPAIGRWWPLGLMLLALPVGLWLALANLTALAQGPKDGDREEGKPPARAEGDREGEGERQPPPPREGDRRPPPPREGEFRGPPPREGDRQPPPPREGDRRPPPPREGDFRGPPRGPEGEVPLHELVRMLHEEVRRLRQELAELRAQRLGPPSREGDRFTIPRFEGEGPRPPREGDRPRPPREGEGDPRRQRQPDEGRKPAGEKSEDGDEKPAPKDADDKEEAAPAKADDKED